MKKRVRTLLAKRKQLSQKKASVEAAIMKVDIELNDLNPPHIIFCDEDGKVISVDGKLQENKAYACFEFVHEWKPKHDSLS